MKVDGWSAIFMAVVLCGLIRRPETLENCKLGNLVIGFVMVSSVYQQTDIFWCFSAYWTSEMLGLPLNAMARSFKTRTKRAGDRRCPYLLP